MSSSIELKSLKNLYLVHCSATVKELGNFLDSLVPDASLHFIRPEYEMKSSKGIWTPSNRTLVVLDEAIADVAKNIAEVNYHKFKMSNYKIFTPQTSCPDPHLHQTYNFFVKVPKDYPQQGVLRQFEETLETLAEAGFYDKSDYEIVFPLIGVDSHPGFLLVNFAPHVDRDAILTTRILFNKDKWAFDRQKNSVIMCSWARQLPTVARPPTQTETKAKEPQFINRFEGLGEIEA